MLSKTKNIPKILEKYLNYMIAIRGCSVNTINAFKTDLMQFFSFIEKYKNMPIPVSDFNIFVMLQIKESDIIAFLTYLNYNRDNSPYTRQRKITAIRSFYRWLFSVHPNAKGKNPASELDSVKKVERLPKYLTLNQAKEIQKVFNISNTRQPYRNKAIITLFLSTGMRLAELISINIGDVDFDSNSIVILGKNNKDRKVYFNNNCKIKLQNYIEIRKQSGENITNLSPLFLNKSGNRIGVQAIKNICKTAYKLIGIDDLGYTVHTLRHTAATIMYDHSNNDILLVKEFLGHSSLASTEIYTHLNNNKIKDAVEKNPLNNYKRGGE